MSAPIRQISLSQAPVFVLNSRLGLSCATACRSNSKYLHNLRLSFSRSYGYILPSSLTRVVPRTLGFSPRLPVSVLVRAPQYLTRSFSRQCSPFEFDSSEDSSICRFSALMYNGFACYTAYQLRRTIPSVRSNCFLCHSFAQTI